VSGVYLLSKKAPGLEVGREHFSSRPQETVEKLDASSPAGMLPGRMLNLSMALCVSGRTESHGICVAQANCLYFVYISFHLQCGSIAKGTSGSQSGSMDEADCVIIPCLTIQALVHPS